MQLATQSPFILKIEVQPYLVERPAHADTSFPKLGLILAQAALSESDVQSTVEETLVMSLALGDTSTGPRTSLTRSAAAYPAARYFWSAASDLINSMSFVTYLWWRSIALENLAMIADLLLN